MESIEIKNFGPIKHVKLDLKDINVFIGTTGSGKSTVAKLVAIARDFSFVTGISFDLFNERIAQYNIAFEITDDTHIKYTNHSFHWELKSRKIKNNGSNWILSTFITMVESVLLLNIRRKYPSDESGLHMRENIQTMLIGMALLHGADQIIKLEYEAKGEELPRQIQDLLIVIKEYNERLNMQNIKADERKAIIDELLRDPRLLELFPLVDTSILPGQIIYIPAERNLLSMVGQSVFGLMSNNVAIAEAVKKFGSEFEAARKQLKQLTVKFLDVEYKYNGNENIIALADNTEIKLEQASSGFQSIIPLLLVIKAKIVAPETLERFFIIEEPELNLYPTVQKKLVELIVEQINEHKFTAKDKLIITTHSPYVLTALDNLIQADNTVKRNPEAEEKVKEMVPPERWVDFDRVTCYYFKDGKCRSTLDEEYRSIGPSNIDDVSDDISKTYDELLALEYANVS